MTYSTPPNRFYYILCPFVRFPSISSNFFSCLFFLTLICISIFVSRIFMSMHISIQHLLWFCTWCDAIWFHSSNAFINQAVLVKCLLNVSVQKCQKWIKTQSILQFANAIICCGRRINRLIYSMKHLFTAQFEIHMRSFCVCCNYHTYFVRW